MDYYRNLSPPFSHLARAFGRGVLESIVVVFVLHNSYRYREDLLDAFWNGCQKLMRSLESSINHWQKA
jgi:hypothetical protein